MAKVKAKKTQSNQLPPEEPVIAKPPKPVEPDTVYCLELRDFNGDGNDTNNIVIFNDQATLLAGIFDSLQAGAVKFTVSVVKRNIFPLPENI